MSFFSFPKYYYCCYLWHVDFHLLCAATGASFKPCLVVSLKLEGPQLCCPFFIGFADHSQCLVSCLDNFCIGILQKVYQIERHLQIKTTPLTNS